MVVSKKTRRQRGRGICGSKYSTECNITNVRRTTVRNTAKLANLFNQFQKASNNLNVKLRTASRIMNSATGLSNSTRSVNEQKLFERIWQGEQFRRQDEANAKRRISDLKARLAALKKK